MLLTGTFERTIDDKLRLALPKPLREALAKDALVVTPGTDGSLAVFGQQAFAALTQRLAARSPTAVDVRAFSRLLYAQSHTTEMDSQGRIRLPAELARLAGLAGDVVLLGVGDHIEIWNKSRWEAYLADLAPRYDQLAESALSESGAAIGSGGVTSRALEAAERPPQPK